MDIHGNNKNQKIDIQLKYIPARFKTGGDISLTSKI